MNTKMAPLLALTGVLIAQAAWAQQSVARLGQLNGNVLVSRDSGMATAAEAQALSNGTSVITTANSRAVVVFDNGCRVELAENQRLEIDSRKACAAMIPQSLGVAPAGGATLGNYVAGGMVIGGALLTNTGGGGSPPTPVSPN